MPNMSYCRFENTLSDLVDCVNALEELQYDEEEISQREWHYAKKMRDWCESYIEQFDNLNEEDITIN